MKRSPATQPRRMPRFTSSGEPSAQDAIGISRPIAATNTAALTFALAAILALPALLTGCGTSDGASVRASDSDDAPALSAFELEHGLGPIRTPVEFGTLDPDMVARGEQLFQYNCEACHSLTDRFVGPAIGDVLDRRSPTWVMNMILNPAEMVREHPEGQKLLAEYLVAMPYQNISEDEARAIVEYFRTLKE